MSLDRERLAAERPEWWMFTGIAGLKRFMPDSAIRYAEEKGYGYVRWYVPVCSKCPSVQAMLTAAQGDA